MPAISPFRHSPRPNRHTRLQRQCGLSLTELMISLLVGLLIMGAVLDAYLGITAAERDALNAAKLNMELRGALDVMTDDIRRAGSGRAVDPEDPNPFTSRLAPFSDLNINADGSCVEFTYDANGNGVLDAATEYYGFRIQDAAIQVRNGGADMTENACGANADDWDNLTDPDLVEIYPAVGVITTGPTPVTGDLPYFSINYQCLNSRTNDPGPTPQPCVAGNAVFDTANAGTTPVDLLEKRTVTISLAGRLKSNPEMRMELPGNTITVSNHRIVTVPPPPAP